MWLDRLAGASSPSPSQTSNRAYSPATRRPSSGLGPYLASQQRPGLSPRTSSLSLASTDSSASTVLGSSRRATGSNLKQTTTAYAGPDPVDVLGALLGRSSVAGSPPASDHSPNLTTSITSEDLDATFDFGKLSLRSLALSDEPQAIYTDKKRQESNGEHEIVKANLEDLHQSIQACDEILASVEINLASFRNDLATVSADIETLQARSATLNVRLKNRKAVEKELAPAVEEISISPIIVTKIADGHVDEAWVKALNEIDKRETAYKRSDSGSEQSKGLQDLGPLLEKLVRKAIERIRDFLVAQIKALRSPHINAQIIQQQNFLKFKDLFTFLHRHQSTLANEICLAYMNTMRWYYINQFTRYENALKKIKLHMLDKLDVLGNEDISRRGAVLSSSRIAGPPHDAFSLGHRIDILRTSNQAAISSYLAEEDQSTHYLETPFRNFNLALIDNVTSEYTFLASFFSPALSYSTISHHFAYIFDPTLQLGQALTKTLVAETYDALGLLLSIRLNQHFQFELQRRKIPAAEGYINGTAMLLWPRLQFVMNAHCESIRALTTVLPTRPPGKADQAKLSTAPHVTTQRFGQLLHGILSMSTEAGDDEPVVTSLRRLRSELEAFLTKYSAAFGTDKRKRERFLYTNYSLVFTIISDVGGKLASEEQEHFEGLKAAFQEAS